MQSKSFGEKVNKEKLLKNFLPPPLFDLQEPQRAGDLVRPLGEDSSAASSNQEQSSLATRSRKAWGETAE
jgi:hypothetical protein